MEELHPEKVAKEAKKSGKPVLITRLTIRCHGVSGRAEIGYNEKNSKHTNLTKDLIDPKAKEFNQKVYNSLDGLTRWMGDESTLVLFACDCGQNESFVQALADLTNSTVYALNRGTGGLTIPHTMIVGKDLAPGWVKAVPKKDRGEW